MLLDFPCNIEYNKPPHSSNSIKFLLEFDMNMFSNSIRAFNITSSFRFLDITAKNAILWKCHLLGKIPTTYMGI